MQPTDDSVLLRQYAENHSDDAFAALVARHVNLVYSVAVRCVGHPHQAEEVSQAVFVLLAKKAGQLGHYKALSSWLFQTTRLTASNFIRGESRRHRREQEAHMQSVLNEPGSDIWPRIAPLLDDAVAGLNEKDRQAIVLRFYEGRNLREVGAALGASEDAAEKRVSRAVEKLRTFFAKRGVTVCASGLAVVIATNAVQAAPIGLAVTISTAAALAVTTFITTATATATKAIAMTTLQKTLITAALVASVGTGIYEARQASILRSQVQALRQQQAALSEQKRRIDASMPLAQLLTNAPTKRFNWESVESTDYKQYLANLRSVGCPEETIRDIIRADVNKLYEGKKKEIRKAAPKFEYWKGDDFLRGAGREAWLRMLAVNEERDATLRALGIAPDSSKKEAKNAAVMDWMMDYLGEEKKAQVLRLYKELEDRLATRAPNSLDLIQIQQLMKERDEAVKRMLTPDEAFQYDLRQPTGTGGRVRHSLACMEPTEQEFVTVYKIRKGFEEQFPDLFPEVQTVNPAELTAAEYRTLRETARQVESQIQEQIRLTLDPERYADFEIAQNPSYQEMYLIAKQADLGPSEAKQLYQARLNAEERASRVQNDPGLTPEQRNAALNVIRGETKKSILGVLGEKAWEQFNRSGNKRWLDQIQPNAAKPNTSLPRP